MNTYEQKLAEANAEELLGAERLFNAYRAGVDGMAVNGFPIPEWPTITNARVKWGWVCAYRAARKMGSSQYDLEEYY